MFKTLKSSLLTPLLFLGILIIPTHSFAISDPAILEVTTLVNEVGPNEEVDFIVSYGNAGSDLAKNVEMAINYDENQINQISLGDPSVCQLNNVTIRCNFNELPGGTTGIIKFTGIIAADVKLGALIRTTAQISEFQNPGEPQQNNFKENVITATGLSGSNAIGAGLPAALGGIGGGSAAAKLTEPTTKQGVAVFDVSKEPNWKTSELSTLGLKFMIRGKEALAWTLNINDSGFDSPAIRGNYLKVLTVVNSLFIIGLLIIAGMWMFSLVIPRGYLRKVVLIYGLAVVLVNFAFPLNQLLIEGSNLLQKTFMSDVDITSIVETPAYNDKNTIGYQNESDAIESTHQKTLSVHLGKTDPAKPTPKDVTIGELKQDFLTPSYIGAINLGKEQGVLELKSTGNDIKLNLNTEQSIELSDTRSFNPAREQSIFAFLMMLMTGLAYFGMTLIFVLRTVILWALLIVSPVLFLLAIFNVTRPYFISWISLYAKWLMIGPIMALGIALMVGLWKSVGLPISSGYTSGDQFGIISNIGFYLPGKDTLNTLSNASQMMEYVIFLTMLYLPLFFAFMLTRQKVWSMATQFASDRLSPANTHLERVAPSTVEKTNVKTNQSTGDPLGKGLIKDFLNNRFANVSQTPLPSSMLNRGRQIGIVPPVNALQRDQLSTAPLKAILNLASGEAQGSRKAHQKGIENLAQPERAGNETTQKKLINIRSEIESRAQQGNPEAINLVNEIHDVQQAHSSDSISNTPLAGATTQWAELRGSAPEKEIKVSIEQETGNRKPEIGSAKQNNYKEEEIEKNEENGEDEVEEEKNDDPSENNNESDGRKSRS